MGSPKITEKEGITMITMGSPKSLPIPVDPIAFVLGEEKAVQLSALEPRECFMVLQRAIQKVKPNLRYLAWHNFREWFEGDLGSFEQMSDFPSALTPETKCTKILIESLVYKRIHTVRYILLTRNGQMFLWQIKGYGKATGVHRVTSLTEKVFLQEFQGKYSLVVSRVLGDLSREFHQHSKYLALRQDEFHKMEAQLSDILERLPPDLPGE